MFVFNDPSFLDDKIFIAKPNTWFDEGTEAKLLQHIQDPCDGDFKCPGFGLFKGFVEGELDEEICNYDEFEIVDTTPDPHAPLPSGVWFNENGDCAGEYNRYD